MGRRLTLSLLAGALLLAMPSTAVLAADFPEPPPPYIPPPVPIGHQWYLRGYIGMTNQKVGSLENALFATTDNLVIHDKNFESGPLFGVGVGFKYNDWLRFDVTGEYRGEVGFHGFDTWTSGATEDPRFNNYTAKKSEWLFLVNAYADLGEWHGVSPYIGAGIGASRNTIHSFRDAGIAYTTPGDLDTAVPTMAYANAASKWNFAWALHAGLGFKVNPALTIDLGYSYVDLGSAQSGDIIAFDDPTGGTYNPMEFKHLTSHDLKLGIRYAFGVGGGGYTPGY